MQFYEYKRLVPTHGLEGLKDLPPVPKSHPQVTLPDMVEKICKRALKHPAWGRTMSDGWRRGGHTEEGVRLTKERIAFIEKHSVIGLWSC